MYKIFLVCFGAWPEPEFVNLFKDLQKVLIWMMIRISGNVSRDGFGF
jgi:hypothetical protein